MEATETGKISGKELFKEIILSPRWGVYYTILNMLDELNLKSSKNVIPFFVNEATLDDYRTLEKYGLLHFFLNEDGKFRYIYITRKGVFLLKKVREIEKQLEKRYFDPLVVLPSSPGNSIADALDTAFRFLMEFSEVEIDEKKKVADLVDGNFKGTGNELKVRVDFSNERKIFCTACESYDCEHVYFVNLILNYLKYKGEKAVIPASEVK